MSVKYLQRIGLIVIAQAILVGALIYTDSSSLRYGSLPSILAAGALLVPFSGYIIGLTSAPFLQSGSGVLRYLLLALVSSAVTLGGYAFFLSLSFRFLWTDYEHP